MSYSSAAAGHGYDRFVITSLSSRGATRRGISLNLPAFPAGFLTADSSLTLGMTAGENVPSRGAHAKPPVIPRSNATRDLFESAGISRRIPDCRFLADARNDSGRECVMCHPEQVMPNPSVIPRSNATRDLLEVARFLTACGMTAARDSHNATAGREGSKIIRNPPPQGVFSRGIFGKSRIPAASPPITYILPAG